MGYVYIIYRLGPDPYSPLGATSELSNGGQILFFYRDQIRICIRDDGFVSGLDQVSTQVLCAPEIEGKNHKQFYFSVVTVICTHHAQHEFKYASVPFALSLCTFSLLCL